MTNETTATTGRNSRTLAGEAHTVTITFPQRCVNVRVAKDSPLTNGFDLSKFTPELIAYAAIEGFAKALADRSEKDATASELQAYRAKRVATWEAGEWAGMGGGVPNPLTATMKEIVINRLLKNGRTMAEAVKEVGTVKAFFTGIAKAKLGMVEGVDDQEALDAMVVEMTDKVETEARAMIAKREAAKQDVKALTDLF